LAESQFAIHNKKLQKEKVKRWAVAGNAAAIVFLVRHGNPRIDEPLSVAMKRCSESKAWRETRRLFRETLRADGDFLPVTKDSVIFLGQEVRHAVIASFPGSNEKQKLSAAFAAAPPWLIWHTFADYTAAMLELPIPDLTRVSRFIRSKKNWVNWWAVPTDAFEHTPWPHGRDNEPMAKIRWPLPTDESSRSQDDQTPRERNRQRKLFGQFEKTDFESWPYLEPAELMRLPEKERRAVARAARSQRERDLANRRPRRLTNAVDVHSIGAPHRY
jgi:hypothetical protein